ncbi:GroES-like protein [Mollisia scopiformis]|uniref:GroES-like protein n=1 Tax=Mollisia scopiformis TaxID=149040 RepID=A0A194X4E8_MOLSC|nr:GroES-like protein [Mollisia scopiformis]KUJ15058.1 GroES-like protein [Mollisia scopiformis]
MGFNLPSQHRALVLESIETGFQLKSIPTPQLSDGSAIVRVEVSGALSYFREIYNGKLGYSFPTPIVGGISAIGRVVALGSDATVLQPGQLVFVDCVIRARDDPSALFLTAIHDGGSDASKKLMRDVWRDGTFAEFVKVPLENCIPLDEARLCRDLGYTVQDLMYISYLLVPYGGLRDIKLEPGETIVVSPATGGYGCAAVMVAIAMGARVIALGRNETKLAKLKEHVRKGAPGANIETVKMTGDEAADTAAVSAFGQIDAALELSPHGAAKSNHLKSVVNALRQNGRCSLMGMAELNIPAWKIVGSNISFRGKLMYERDDMLQFVKMLERGMFPTGKDFVTTKAFGIENWKEGFEVAAEYIGVGQTVVFTP